MIGMVIMPLTAPTRGRAIYDWFVWVMATSLNSYLIEVYYPSWEAPSWRTGAAWTMLAWAICILGLVIAIRKPRKKKTPVA